MPCAVRLLVRSTANCTVLHTLDLATHLTSLIHCLQEHCIASSATMHAISCSPAVPLQCRLVHSGTWAALPTTRCRKSAAAGRGWLPLIPHPCSPCLAPAPSAVLTHATNSRSQTAAAGSSPALLLRSGPTYTDPAPRARPLDARPSHQLGLASYREPTSGSCNM